MMEIDEMTDENMPLNLHRFALFTCRAYSNRTQYTDLMLTKGPIIYELKGKHILTSCDLTNTVLKEAANSSNARINVYYSYKKKTKDAYYFVKIDDHMIILGKIATHFVIKREFEYVKDYRVFDANCTGESTVEIAFINGSSDSFDLAALGHPKYPEMRSGKIDSQKFENFTRKISDRVAEAESKLVDIKRSIQKEFTEYATECQFTGKTPDENGIALARYGDIWIKYCNEQVVIGIPVYNCSIKKYLIENIRVSLFCPNQSHLLYAQSCYEFHMECNRVTPSNIANVGQDSKPFEHLSFGDDWTSRKGAVLYPETAAIIVLRTNVTHFSETNEFLLDAFILYNIVDETGKSIELQLHAGRIQFDTDVLHDRNYAIQFDKDHVLSDLLAVVATTAHRRIEITFEEEQVAQEFQNIFIDKLRFDEITISSKPTEFTEHFLLTQRDAASPTNDPEPHKMFFHRHDGYWNGTLLRMRETVDPNAVAEYRYQLKIYNKLNEKIDGLVKLLLNNFGRKMSIVSSEHQGDETNESVLRQNLREEKAALQELATSLRTKLCNEDDAYRKFIDKQRKTDITYLKINNGNK